MRHCKHASCGTRYIGEDQPVVALLFFQELIVQRMPTGGLPTEEQGDRKDGKMCLLAGKDEMTWGRSMSYHHDLRHHNSPQEHVHCYNNRCRDFIYLSLHFAFDEPRNLLIHVSLSRSGGSLSDLRDLILPDIVIFQPSLQA